MKLRTKLFVKKSRIARAVITAAMCFAVMFASFAPLAASAEEVTEMPLSFSISIQSDTACRAVFRPLTEPARLMAPP